MAEYFENQRQIEADMLFRHPWFNLFYNWLIAVLVVSLFASFVWWGLDIRARNMAEEMTARVLADMDAEHEQMMEAETASQAYVYGQEATAVAKAFYGINKFVDVYHYSEKDLETYARAMFNRAEQNKAELHSVIVAPDQFTGYSDGNTVLQEYYDLALRLVEGWHSESVKPCDTSFIFAELRPDGIWLKNDLHADGYARRWHA